VNPAKPSFTDLLNLVDAPLGTLPLDAVRPSRETLEKIMEEYR
jgi:2-oxoglutarate ferredoxin oxidoreductase subunit beta